jgi:cytidylate kinase
MNAPSTFVITISRQIGAGGAYVGQGLARRLGIHYVDREILQKAAVLLGREEGDLEELEERASSLWDRVASILSLGAPEAPFVPPPIQTVAEDELFEVESQVMREIAAREDAVFVGRGASWVLRRHPGVLRVFLHAAEAWRAERLLESYRLADLDAARQLIRRNDQQRGRFVQELLGAPWTSPGSYDLCVNTGEVGLETTIDVLAAVAESRRGRVRRAAAGAESH